MTTTVRLRDLIAPHFWNSFNSRKTHQIYKGGRGSTKTSMVALKVAKNVLKEDNCSAVVLRRHQNTLRKSVYKEMKRALKRLGLVENVDFVALLSPMEIRILKNGNTIYFAGGDDYENVKGLIDENKLIKIVWFEELTGWDIPEDVEQIIATFTRGNDDWFMALYTYNPPKNKYDWVNLWEKEMSKRMDVLVSHTDYRTVSEKWLGRMFIDEANALRKTDEKRYNWIYLGMVIGLEGLVLNPDLIEWVPANYIQKNNVKILYLDFSIDSGHRTSATSCGCYGFGSDGYWYRLDTYYYSPNEKPVKKAPSQLSKELFEFKHQMVKKYKAPVDQETIDSAEGALRNQYYLDFGVTLHAVNKGKNKEELADYTDNFMSKRKFRVLNNNNNLIFKKEIHNYRWKEGSVERGKPEPDKTEKAFLSGEKYYNTYSKDYAYTYAEHSCDDFEYWVKDNLEKLGLKF